MIAGYAFADPLLRGLGATDETMSYALDYLHHSLWGIPPMKYVNGIRIERAKELLAKTDKSITVIAEETGFSSIHYFSRYFKEKEHMTPQAYRAGFAGKLNPRENDPGDEEDGEKQRNHL